MTIYIASVDGDATWTMKSASKSRLLMFLETYDHEGSSLQLDTDDQFGGTIFDNEHIYEYLRNLDD